MDHAALLPARLGPLAPQLLGEVAVEAAGEGQHEGQDVGGDVVVVDLAEVRDGN